MTTLEKLQKEEQELHIKENNLSNELNQVRRIKETSEEHFYEAHHFFDTVCYQFHQNESGAFYQSVMDEFSQKSRQAIEQLTDNEENLLSEKKKIDRQLEDISYEKRKVLVEEEKNER